MKKIFAILLALLLLCGCANAPAQGQQTQPPNKTVGICLPDFSWNMWETALSESLEAHGYQVLVEYAGSDLQRQQMQLETFVNMPVGCVILAAIDSLTLLDTLEDARQENVPVIALDRMLTYTQAVTGCVSADSYAAGQALGQHIIKSKQLDTAQAPVSIEFFMGEPENHNSLLLYQGVMEQLQPYLTSGMLYCLSGRIAFEDVCIPDGTGDSASDRMFDQLAEKEKSPQIICAATDALAAGCIDALASYGMSPEDGDWPLITGMGATEDALEYISLGYQSMTLHVDIDALVQQCTQWAGHVIDGQTLTGTMVDNGIKQVPCALLPVTLVDKRNYQNYMTE